MHDGMTRRHEIAGLMRHHALSHVTSSILMMNWNDAFGIFIVDCADMSITYFKRHEIPPAPRIGADMRRYC